MKLILQLQSEFREREGGSYLAKSLGAFGLLCLRSSHCVQMFSSTNPDKHILMEFYQLQWESAKHRLKLAEM